MSHNSIHDHYNLKIRCRFFRFWKFAKLFFLRFMRLLLKHGIDLNLGPFRHIRDADMLIDIATKDCKNINICFFNARSLKINYDFFHQSFDKVNEKFKMILTKT